MKTAANNTKPVKVFIVDDHYMVIEGIRSMVQPVQTIEWMGHATNAKSCLAFLASQVPDVILMDINLPDKNGVELCKEVLMHYPSQPARPLCGRARRDRARRRRTAASGR